MMKKSGICAKKMTSVPPKARFGQAKFSLVKVSTLKPAIKAELKYPKIHPVKLNSVINLSVGRIIVRNLSTGPTKINFIGNQRDSRSIHKVTEKYDIHDLIHGDIGKGEEIKKNVSASVDEKFKNKLLELGLKNYEDEIFRNKLDDESRNNIRKMIKTFLEKHPDERIILRMDNQPEPTLIYKVFYVLLVLFAPFLFMLFLCLFCFWIAASFGLLEFCYEQLEKFIQNNFP